MSRRLAAWVVLILLGSPGVIRECRAQGMGRQWGSRLAPGVSPGTLYGGGAASYLPYGGMGGGYVPYSSGSGLGVQPRAAMPRAERGPRGSIGSMTGSGMARFGGARGGVLSPLEPIQAIGRGGMGAPTEGRGVGSRMRVVPRRPVGAYPFRQPPSLIGPATAGPAMAM